MKAINDYVENGIVCVDGVFPNIANHVSRLLLGKDTLPPAMYGMNFVSEFLEEDRSLGGVRSESVERQSQLRLWLCCRLVQ